MFISLQRKLFQGLVAQFGSAPPWQLQVVTAKLEGAGGSNPPQSTLIKNEHSDFWMSYKEVEFGKHWRDRF